jgi:hypothetical protein
MMKQQPVDARFLKTIVTLIETAADQRFSRRDRQAALRTLAFFHADINMDHLRAAWRVLHRVRAT